MHFTVFKGEDFEKPVIPWQRITAKNQFCLTKAGTVILDSMAFLSDTKGYEYLLLAALNSNVVYYWIKKNVSEYGSTGFRLSNQYVEKIPIPKSSQTDIEEINNLIQEEIKNPSKDYEQRINKFIYNLYKFSDTEINYLERNYSVD